MKRLYEKSYSKYTLMKRCLRKATSTTFTTARHPTSPDPLPVVMDSS